MVEIIELVEMKTNKNNCLLELVWFELVWFGFVVWFGLVWSVWFGWFGLV